MARIIVTGYMLRHPVAGNVLAFFHYVLGLHRLGHQVVYLEESGWPYSCYDPVTQHWQDHPHTGLRVVAALMRDYCPAVPVIFVNRDTGATVGTTPGELKRLLRDADLLLNIGGVCWLPQFNLCQRRALIDMDPFFSQIEGFASKVLHEYHVHFSYGANIGRAGCTIPTQGIEWQPLAPPVVLDLWEGAKPAPDAPFTTVANWGAYGKLKYQGEEYGQKNQEFERLIALPVRTRQNLELAVSGAGDQVCQRWRAAGWSVRDAGQEVSADLATYRGYIRRSRGEFSAAKNAYVKSRSGWFSDRSVCYLAAGLPVVLQDTGFSDWLPTGCGVMAFSTADEAADSLEKVAAAYAAHRTAAREIAERVFSHEAVLPRLLDLALGLPAVHKASRRRSVDVPRASIIVNNFNYGRFLRQALDSALAQGHPRTEVIVVDDGSTDNSREIIASYGRRVIPVLKDNGGQASSFNAGFAASRGEVVLFLDADDWLLPAAVERVLGLFAELDVAKVHWPLWVVGPDGQRTGATWPRGGLPEGDLRERARRCGPGCSPSPPTSGNAWARAFLERVMPMPEAEYRLCADDYLCALAPAFGPIRRVTEPQGCYRIHGANNHQQRSFDEKLRAGLQAQTQQCRALAEFFGAQHVAVESGVWQDSLWFFRLKRATEELDALLPEGCAFILVDEEQWGTGRDFAGRCRWSFPDLDGSYGGAPLDDAAAIAELDRLRRAGAEFIVFAWSSFWWLEVYAGLNRFLRERFDCVMENERLVVFDLRVTVCRPSRHRTLARREG